MKNKNECYYSFGVLAPKGFKTFILPIIISSKMSTSFCLSFKKRLENG